MDIEGPGAAKIAQAQIDELGEGEGESERQGHSDKSEAGHRHTSFEHGVGNRSVFTIGSKVED